MTSDLVWRSRRGLGLVFSTTLAMDSHYIPLVSVSPLKHSEVEAKDALRYITVS